MPIGRAQPFKPGALGAAAATAAAAASSLQIGELLGWQQAPLAVTGPATTGNTPGSATAQLGPVPLGQAYLVERVSLSVNQGGATASLQSGGAEMDYTDHAERDNRAEQPAIWVGPGGTFAVVFGGLVSLAKCQATVQYRVVAQ